MSAERPPLSALLADRAHEHPRMNVKPIQDLFGKEPLPAIDESQAGRIRLHQALANKFGPSYKSYPHVKAVLDHYDNESKFLNTYKRLLVRGGRTAPGYEGGS